MRLHANHSHIDWAPEALHAAVTLNGVRQDCCMYANEEQGFVDVMARHNGKLVPRSTFPGDPIMHRLFGEVKIIIDGARDVQA